MMELPEEFDSIFRYIVVVSQRAEQIINGAKVRSDTRHSKPTLAAKDDVDGGLVNWRVLTQEELDAQRQAIVEQFRAEMGSDRVEGVEATTVRDVLPTAADAPEVVARDAEAIERDEELARLQRLLGMVSSGDEDQDEDQDEDDEDQDEDDEEIEEVSLEEELDLDVDDDFENDDE